jgi:prepilin-type N-terminal cleavage/methylation domain-containing protein
MRTVALNHTKTPESRSSGFSLLELTVVLAIMLAILAFALISHSHQLQYEQLTGDARGLAHQISLARMRAGTDYTWAQISVNSSETPNSYTLQLCTVKGASGCTTFSTEGGTQYLSAGDSFGFGSSSGAAGGQTTAAQTSQLIFNSRGIPIDTTGAPTANDTIYLADTSGRAMAVSVTLSGHVKVWLYAGESNWIGQ